MKNKGNPEVGDLYRCVFLGCKRKARAVYRIGIRGSGAMDASLCDVCAKMIASLDERTKQEQGTIGGKRPQVTRQNQSEGCAGRNTGTR
jgi:uncharacterized protein (DUF2237 family)